MNRGDMGPRNVCILRCLDRGFLNRNVGIAQAGSGIVPLQRSVANRGEAA